MKLPLCFSSSPIALSTAPGIAATSNDDVWAAIGVSGAAFAGDAPSSRATSVSPRLTAKSIAFSS
jgi:hypothetical protein